MNSNFDWNDIQSLTKSRPNLGLCVDVRAYRMLEYSIRTILQDTYGLQTSNRILFEAGEFAGKQFCINELDKTLEFYPFIAQLQNKLRKLGISIMRVEESDPENYKLTITMEEDLDCSGLSETNQTMCQFDEGFLAGILSVYSGINIVAKEIECWATGSQMCRFQISKNG